MTNLSTLLNRAYAISPPATPPGVRSLAARPALRLCWLLALAGLGGLGGRQVLGIDDLQLQRLEQRTLRQAAAVVEPSVVKIETIGGLEKVGGLLVGDGPTTGLIVGKEGYIISSAINFIQQPASILVTLPNGQREPARIVSKDHARSLVLLKVETEAELPVPVAADPENVQVGQWALALGRALVGEGTNLSVGIVSAQRRVWDKAIQTDAKISSGNYGGPLVNIRGEVLGVLVPLSPQSTSEIAGAEWYDSGIGFAIPLADIFARLEQLKQGDLYAGLMGIALKGNDLYGSEPIIGVAQPNSPAYEAGLKAGDRIISVNDRPLARQSELKQALGPLYAGDSVNLAIQRGDERLLIGLTLVDKLLPYEHPFLGLLPRRDQQGEGVAVRMVYPDSAAAKAGLQAADLLLAVNDVAVGRASELRDRLATLKPNDTVRLTVARGDESLSLEAPLGTLPTAIPGELPSAADLDQAQAERGEAPLGKIDIQLVEEAGNCVAYVPSSYDARVPCGLLVTLPQPGKFQLQDWLGQWQALADETQVIVLAPQAKEADRWLPTETAFVQKTIDYTLDRYRVDRSRVVLYGERSGGAMAFLAGFELRELVRGIAVLDTAVPARAPLPANDPLNRLAILIQLADKSPLNERITSNIETIEEQKIPVTQIVADDERKEGASLEDRRVILRWLDTLDRL